MIKRIVAAAAILLAALAPAAAQFADQATYAGAGAGTANAQTLTLANASSYADLVGVIVKFVPAATNTAAATLTVNGFGSSPPLRKPNGAGLTALTGGEIVSGQPAAVMYDGTYFVVMAPVALPIGAENLKTSALGFDAPVNLQINATVSANALTIALKGANGSDASSTNPIIVPFRDVTIAQGGPTFVSITSALSLTVASTSTMGCVSGQMCRLWVVLMNNSGVPVLGAFNALSGANVAPINEAALQTCAAGTSGGSAAQTYYCSVSAVTAKAIRIVGYLDVSEVTAGTWATGPTYVQLFGPGIKKPGEVVQSIQFTSVTQTDTTSATFVNTSLTAAITPTSAANPVRYHATGGLITTGGGAIAFARMNRTVAATPTSIGPACSEGAVTVVTCVIAFVDIPNTTAAATYTVQLRNTGGIVTVSFPYYTAPFNFGSGGVLQLEEIMG